MNPLKWLMKTFNSSIGLKFIMSLTGLGLVGFVLVHMLGNLQVLIGAFDAQAGQEALNSYAKKLQDLGPGLWVARIGLLAMFAIHIACAIRLTLSNQKARPVPYQYEATVQASWASRYMMLTGLVVLGFVVLHLLHFTLHGFDIDGFDVAVTDAAGRKDVYRMVIKGFGNWFFAAIYIACNILLGVHISHGASSLFQSIGINHPRYLPAIRALGPILGATVVVGNLAIVLACMLGIIPDPELLGGGS